jgi:predicted lipid-binding transport protein (Tim44 family)
MASSVKKKTTMAKLSRENRQREKRAEKAARAAHRKREGTLDDEPTDDTPVEEAWQLTRGLSQLEG